ncbi:Protein containing a possible START(Steroidogenic acute regulatory (STAR) related lipid transfer) domain,related [Neospora caninum Liverpool]|uniref:Protein containing a possible START(Steroidogenic acute regulatory (STAR) related lipid transfer) domain,related n=1 Tax=Neospora caninum (strain Liverpool) TaxID=572307 RepID=F0VKP0_NEOCL|nr:Protein containing a possible START(Steroidogenic acute regulatory (STAR) related lipid transfer) domain,related [Neospora caninum Liverpool]CBZ54641.1 Protein containing a possible START(Steroidogenic acute regulatory (STAR) related lipid transfer) domain,related [Neospora caninum Liverpool]CEL69357.1 TPA: Protein containing a possible START(Steroidogenic acute regulatory (STAR) related lipid transfer) domain,related [Neospora caninum Liverpool]|eukprot:XP_003884671.1 Protein containing a possible START(Steroidogenic acute regulatory (STAR) related lipid transfer) domain,related [Neospora caninum Liverpool]
MILNRGVVSEREAGSGRLSGIPPRRGGDPAASSGFARARSSARDASTPGRKEERRETPTATPRVLGMKLVSCEYADRSRDETKRENEETGDRDITEGGRAFAVLGADAEARCRSAVHCLPGPTGERSACAAGQSAEGVRDHAEPARRGARERRDGVKASSSVESLFSCSSSESLQRVSLLRPSWLPAAAPPAASGAPEPPAFLREEAAALLQRAKLRALEGPASASPVSRTFHGPQASSLQTPGAATAAGGEPHTDRARPATSSRAAQAFFPSAPSSRSYWEAASGAPGSAPRTPGPEQERHRDASLSAGVTAPRIAEQPLPRPALSPLDAASASGRPPPAPVPAAKAKTMPEGTEWPLSPVAGSGVSPAALPTAYLCRYEPEFGKAPARPCRPGGSRPSSAARLSALPPACRPPPAIDVLPTPFAPRGHGETASCEASAVSAGAVRVPAKNGDSRSSRRNRESGPGLQSAVSVVPVLPDGNCVGRMSGTRRGDAAAHAGKGIPEVAGPAALEPPSAEAQSPERHGDVLSPKSEAGRTRRRRRTSWRNGPPRRSSRSREAGGLPEGVPEKGAGAECAEATGGAVPPSSRRPPRWIRFFARRLICLGPREGKDPLSFSKRHPPDAHSRDRAPNSKDSTRLAAGGCPVPAEDSQSPASGLDSALLARPGAAPCAPPGLGEPTNASLQRDSEKARTQMDAAADGAVLPAQRHHLGQFARREGEPREGEGTHGEGEEEGSEATRAAGVGPSGDASERSDGACGCGVVRENGDHANGVSTRGNVDSDTYTLSSEHCEGGFGAAASQGAPLGWSHERQLSGESFSSAASRRQSETEGDSQGEGTCQGTSRTDVERLLSHAEEHGKRQARGEGGLQSDNWGLLLAGEKERRASAGSISPERETNVEGRQTLSPETCSTEASPVTAQEGRQAALSDTAAKEERAFVDALGRAAGPHPSEAALALGDTAPGANRSQACREFEVSAAQVGAERPLSRSESFGSGERRVEETGGRPPADRKESRERLARPSPADSFPGLSRLASSADAAEFVLGVLEERRAAFNLRQNQASVLSGHSQRQANSPEKTRPFFGANSATVGVQCSKQGMHKQGTRDDAQEKAGREGPREGAAEDWDRQRELLDLAELLLDVAVICLDEDATTRSGGPRGETKAPTMPCVYDKNGLKVWKKEFGVGRVLVKASFMLPVLPEQYASFASDSRLRATWDANLGGHAILETLTTNTDICQVSLKRVATLYPRDLVTLRARRSWAIPTPKHEPADHAKADERREAKQVYASCSCSIDHPAAPEHTSHVRMDIRLSAYVASPVVTPFGVWTEVTLFSEADPKGWIPGVVSRSLAAKVLPSTVEKMAVNMLNHYGIAWDGPSATGYASRRLATYCEQAAHGGPRLKFGR